MNLYTVMTEIAAAVDTISGLRVYPWDQQNITPPAAVVTLPESIDYHATYGTGLQRITDLMVVVLIGKASDRIALKRIAEYAAAAGARSVRAAIENATYTSLSVITVTRAEFVRDQDMDGTEFLAAHFHCDITGPAT